MEVLHVQDVAPAPPRLQPQLRLVAPRRPRQLRLRAVVLRIARTAPQRGRDLRGRRRPLIVVRSPAAVLDHRHDALPVAPALIVPVEADLHRVRQGQRRAHGAAPSVLWLRAQRLPHLRGAVAAAWNIGTGLPGASAREELASERASERAQDERVAAAALRE